ncbi:MAG: hypothetical protein AAFN93_09735 [Bacteroidota bacterium]
MAIRNLEVGVIAEVLSELGDEYIHTTLGSSCCCSRGGRGLSVTLRTGGVCGMHIGKCCLVLAVFSF